MANNRGYVLLQRLYWEHPLFKPKVCSNMEAWVWLTMAAAHAPRDVATVNGRHRGMIHLEPGQLTFSVRFLAKAWGWSDKRVQRFFGVLARDRLVTTQTTTGQTIITLCNWSKDQRPFEATTTQTATQPTTQSTTKKNELNEFNDVVGPYAREPAKPLFEKVEVSPEKQAAVALGLDFLNAAGFKDHAEAPMNWYGVTDRAAKWIKAGYTPAMIVAETKQIAGQGGDTKPLAYFDKVFATAMARANQPLPVVATPLPGVAHSGQRGSVGNDGARSTSAAFARLRERLEQDQPSDDIFGSALRLPPPR